MKMEGSNGEKKKLEDLEARAVAEAKASADSTFRPAPSLLNGSSPEAIMTQVDGPSLDSYEGKESIYVGRSVPIGAGAQLKVPIQVTTPGSVVEYFIDVKTYDLVVGITAEREEGTTVVRKANKADSSNCPLTQKFLVGSVPCLIIFVFDNEYSWMREKVISYKITVTPPTRESLMAGRRRRAKSCEATVTEDLESARQRLSATEEQKSTLSSDIERLEKELEEKKKSLDVALEEEAWLTTRVNLRIEQQKILQTRLKEGWKDEKKEEKASWF